MRSINRALVNGQQVARIKHDIAIVTVIRIQVDHHQVQVKRKHRNILKSETIRIAVVRGRIAIADMDDQVAEIVRSHGIDIEDSIEIVDRTLDPISIAVETKTEIAAIIEIAK